MHAPGVLWRSVVQVSGVATEVLGIQASTGPAQLQILLVPGNPGSALYYSMQLHSLYSALGSRVDVLAVSHAGHSSDPLLELPGQAVWSLDRQIQHKADFIRQHLLLPGRPPLVVAGHSIGAHMAVHAVACAESDPEYLASTVILPPVLKVIAMFPFFWIDKSQFKIRALSFAAARYELMGRVAQLLSLLPRWLLISVIKRFTRGSMEDSSVEVTAQLLTRRSVRSFFFLAHTEFRDLKQPPNWQLLKSLSHRLHVLGCPEDIWMTRNQYNQLLHELPSMQSTWVEEARHAYCTSRPQCEAVNAVVTGLALESLAQHQKLPQAPMAGSQLGSASSTSSFKSQDEMRLMEEGSLSRL